jgi:hypothetical protein
VFFEKDDPLHKFRNWKAALDGWLAGEDGESVRLRTARAYDKYQNCGLRAAQGLFATGW